MPGFTTVTQILDKDLDDILEAAASWHSRLDLGTADLAASEAWRAADQRHAAAFARMEGTDSAYKSAKGHILDETDEFDTSKATLNRREWLKGALMGLGGVTVLAGAFASVATHRAHAETRVGEKADHTLPDRGGLTLNTDSEASWRFDKQVREVWLQRGEMALYVPVETRPCRIHAGGLVVVVQYGKLNIRLRHDGAEVTLLDGPGAVVAVDERQADVVMSVDRGQSVSLIKGVGQVNPLTDAQLQSVNAWRSDEMMFTGQTLAVVVDEYNRYLTRKIVIGDPGLTDLRLGGRFNVHDTTAFLQALRSTFNIRSTDNGKVILLTR
jgi:transmembrane sensor